MNAREFADTLGPLAAYCVVLPVHNTVACKSNHWGFSWYSRPDAWRNLPQVLTWDTQEGAQLFADMNGGTVKPLSEVFDQSVILPTTESQPTDPE